MAQMNISQTSLKAPYRFGAKPPSSSNKEENQQQQKGTLIFQGFNPHIWRKGKCSDGL